jgi:hypothetical protein
MTTYDLDQWVRLVGDEDCGVSIACNTCDRGGLPLAYYPGIGNSPYSPNDGVVTVTTIDGLLTAARGHINTEHRSPVRTFDEEPA